MAAEHLSDGLVAATHATGEQEGRGVEREAGPLLVTGGVADDAGLGIVRDSSKPGSAAEFALMGALEPRNGVWHEENSDDSVRSFSASADQTPPTHAIEGFTADRPSGAEFARGDGGGEF